MLTGLVMNHDAEYTCPTTFSSGSVLHLVSLFNPLPQKTSGVTPPTSQTTDTGLAPIAEVLFLSHQARE